jgi:hypothetical protein
MDYKKLITCEFKMQVFFSYETLSKEKLLLLLSLPLPECIRRYIYENHFAPKSIYKIKYELLLREVKSSECQRLNPYTLKLMILPTLDDPIFCKFICERNNIFAKNFKQHFVENRSNFVLMNQIDSFVLSWLMILYH